SVGGSGSVSETGGLVFSPEGRLIVIPAEENSLVLHDVNSGTELRRIIYSEQIGPPRSIAFSPDGRSMLLDFGAEQLGMYEVATGRDRRFFARREPGQDPLMALNGISAEMFDLAPLAFSPDGRLVAHSSLRGNIGLWDICTGRQLGEFQGHRGDLVALRFSHDGKRLASGSADTTALIWDLSKLTPSARPERRKLSLQELQNCWADLLAPDSAKALLSMDMLADAPIETSALLKSELTKPPAPLNVKQIEQWIGEL